ncbi:predicted protein [Nematostella vectensis]|uniref:FERM domain-containing protein n=1 Tax=Nematostella vectensis TaxID=45351 RepID=A7S4L3_NEMVE|nr:predicted protein [Nematostella vectensis]|eukprot:XP_001633364.1 predicted protein [Nematostella vectensis]
MPAIRSQSIIYGTKLQPSFEREFRVALLDRTTFSITFEESWVKARVLFDCVCKVLELQSKDYFGLQFTGKDHDWVDLKDELSARKGRSLNLKFGVRFYPRNVRNLEYAACELLCLHIKQLITKDCFIGLVSVKQHAIFDGFFAQFWLGDYDTTTSKEGFLASQLGQFFAPVKRSGPEFIQYERLATEFYRQNSNTKKGEVVLKFLETAIELPLYGLSLHVGARDSRKIPVLLGFGCNGVFVYELNNHGHVTNLLFEFTWREIPVVRNEKKKLRLVFYSKQLDDSRVFTFRFVVKDGKKLAKRAAKDAAEIRQFYHDK